MQSNMIYTMFETISVQCPELWMAGGLMAVLVTLWLLIRGEKDPRVILNEKGQHIKEIKTDVRIQKFVRSLQLSKQGQELAGNEPYLIHSGPYRELVISQPDHIQQFYKNDAKDHGKPKNFNLGELTGRLTGSAVGMKYGDGWRMIRKHFDPAFSSHSRVKNMSRFGVEIQQWLEGLATNPIVEVDSKSSFKFLTFRLLALHLYGDAFDDRIYWRLLELNDLHENVMRSLLMSKWPDSKLWNMLPTAANRQLSNFLLQWKEFNNMIIEHSRGGKWNCPAEVIYKGVDPDHEFSEKEFLATMDEILFSNVEVSVGVLSKIFTSLAHNSSVQKKLREEIKHWKKDPNLGQDKYLSNSDTLLNRVVLESMRLSPASCFSMPETIVDNKMIGGYSVPARTSVVIDTRRLNNETVTWGDDGTEFKPDRFLNMPQEKLRCGFMNFGMSAASGRCLGKNVADILFKLTTVAMVERFSLDPPSEGREKVAGQGQDLVLTRFRM